MPAMRIRDRWKELVSWKVHTHCHYSWHQQDGAAAVIVVTNQDYQHHLQRASRIMVSVFPSVSLISLKLSVFYLKAEIKKKGFWTYINIYEILPWNNDMFTKVRVRRHTECWSRHVVYNSLNINSDFFHKAINTLNISSVPQIAISYIQLIICMWSAYVRWARESHLLGLTVTVKFLPAKW